MKPRKLFRILTIWVALHSLPIISYGQWIPQISNTNSTLYTASFVDSLNGWVVGDSGLILRTTNGGEQWNQQNSSTIATFQSVSFCNNLNGWATGKLGTILKTSDGGMTWNQVYHDTSYKVNHFKVQCINQMVTYILRFRYTDDFVEDFRIWKTEDNGTTWNDISPYQGNFIALNDMYFVSETQGYACGHGLDGVGPDGYQIHKTMDSGLNWNTYSFNVPTLWAMQTIFFEDLINGWATDWDTLYHTSNGGDTWEVAGIPGFNDLSDIVMYDTTGYASRIIGKIKKTTDGGVTWFEQSSSPPNFIEDLEFINPDIGWAVGWNGMIYHTKNGGVTSIKHNEPNDIPTTPILYQNYPNPFNPTTSIVYKLSHSGTVELILYNNLGQKMKTLYSGKQRAGEYQIKLDGRELPSGIYFYTLQTGNFSLTRKCLILK